MRGNYLFTSESVSEGHPDKVCDRISDAIVDEFLGADPMAKVACETLVTTNLIVLAGEVRMAKTAAGPKEIMSKSGKVNKKLAEKIARKAVKEIGYAQNGFHWNKAKVQVHLHGQSADIAQGVDKALEAEYRRIGRFLKEKGRGGRGVIITGNLALSRRFGLKVASIRTLFNGPIECRCLEFDLSGPPGAIAPPSAP